MYRSMSESLEKPPKKEKSRRASGKERSSEPSWKRRERSAARVMQEHCGVENDPGYKTLVTSTGRIGHLTPLQHDLSNATYCGEVKEWRIRQDLVDAYVQIMQIALTRKKKPVLILYMKNQTEFTHDGKKHKLPAAHIIPEWRHLELIDAENELEELKTEIMEKQIA